MFSSAVYRNESDFHWISNSQPDAGPVRFHGPYAGAQKWFVDRLFLRTLCGSVFWIRVWILCFDLYVYWLSERVCTQDLL